MNAIPTPASTTVTPTTTTATRRRPADLRRAERRPTRLVRRVTSFIVGGVLAGSTLLAHGGAAHAGYVVSGAQIACSSGSVFATSAPTAIGQPTRDYVGELIDYYAVLQQYNPTTRQWVGYAFAGPYKATWSKAGRIVPIQPGVSWLNPNGSLNRSQFGPRPSWTVARGYAYRIDTLMVDSRGGMSAAFSEYCYA